MRASFLFLPLLAAAAAAPAPAQLRPGKEAPEIQAKDWFNGPPATSLAELRGRVVFLEFWATW